jgi:hypothetical protein
MKARDLIKPGEVGVAVFTRGEHFVHKPDGSGFTGNWVINTHRKIDKVIIYKQDAKGKQHEIYVGDFVGITDSEDLGRHKIEMINIKPKDHTNLNWNEFTGTKPGAINPIKYIGK